MITNNRLDKYFGPSGNTAGVILIIAGLIMSYYSVSAIVIIFIGAYIGFTSTGTSIDFDLKRIRFNNNIFGIISTGKWMDVEPGMKLGIERSNISWRTYSRSNRVLNTGQKDYRVFIYDSGGKKIMPLIKTDTKESANKELDELAGKLELARK